MKKRGLKRWLSERELCSTGATPLLKWRKEQHEAGELVKKRKHSRAPASFSTLEETKDRMGLPRLEIQTSNDRGPCFTGIPTDVLKAHIFPYLADYPDLTSLMKTCRSFYHAIQQYLHALAVTRYGPRGTAMAMVMEAFLRHHRIRHGYMPFNAPKQKSNVDVPSTMVMRFIEIYGYMDVFPYIHARHIHNTVIETRERAFIHSTMDDRIRQLNDAMKRKNYHRTNVSGVLHLFKVDTDVFADFMALRRDADLNKLLAPIPPNTEEYVLAWATAIKNLDMPAFLIETAMIEFFIPLDNFFLFKMFLSECHNQYPTLRFYPKGPTVIRVFFFWDFEGNRIAINTFQPSYHCVDHPVTRQVVENGTAITYTDVLGHQYVIQHYVKKE